MTVNKKVSYWNILPLHVLFAAMYPALALLAFNLTEVTPQVVIRPLWVSAAMGLATLILAWIVTREWRRAGLVATLFIALFFSYGHLYHALDEIQLGGVFIFRHRTMLVLWAALGAWGGWAFWKKPLPLATITSALNLATLALVIMPLVQVGAPVVGDAFASARETRPEAATPPEVRGDAPDVYYIILDAHGRADVLSQHTGYDSSTFLNSLKEMGFYVADCSQTNYSLTLLSLSSSLNYSHLEELTNDAGGVDFQSAIADSALRRFLERRGYETVAFASGFRMTEIKNVDYYFEPGSPKGGEFEAQLLDTTLWSAFVDIGITPAFDVSAENYRDRTLLTLATLKDLPDLAGPQFVFAHIVSPHPPYIFDAQGNFHDVAFKEQDELAPLEMAPLYRAQAEFIDAQILEVVRVILEKSDVPPIIIIQGDHGPLVKDRFIRAPILNAYYLPNGQDGLYPSISPVNSFRVVLNDYFGQNLPMLEDLSRFSSDYRDPFDYRVVENSCVK
ncbi:MAG: sulfatase-like hydrolase/transferase [Chloroflexi bacterium]|nr:sulfatase-like hydrolase/transferase [Chloroflexota bacterium]